MKKLTAAMMMWMCMCMWTFRMCMDCCAFLSDVFSVSTVNRSAA